MRHTLLKEDKMNSNETTWEYLSVKMYGPDYKYYGYSEVTKVWSSQIYYRVL